MKIGGWIVAVAAVAAAGWFAYQTRTLRETVEVQQAEITGLQRHVAQLQDLQADLERIGEEMGVMARDIEEAEAWHKARLGLDEEAPAADPVAEAAAVEADAAGAKSPLAGLMDMFKGEGGAKMRDAAAKMQVDLQCAGRLKDLALPAEVDSEVRGILAHSMSQQIEAGMGMMDGSATSGKELKDQERAAVAELRAMLSQVLTVEELAQWEAYEEDKPRRMMEQSYDMQLGMFAPAMDEETRLLVRDTLVAHMMVNMEDFAASDAPTGMSGPFEQQLGAFERVREDLLPLLDDEQYAQVDQFLAQQEQMLEVTLEMMRGFLDPAAD
jgi:hypothetical protein